MNLDYELNDVLPNKHTLMIKKLKKNRTIARVVLVLAKLFETKRAIHTIEITNMLGLDAGQCYRVLRFLESVGVIGRHQTPDRMTFYFPRMEGESKIINDYVEEAMKSLNVKSKKITDYTRDNSKEK